MADISEWSPVDESNNQPPPNGFPEGMAPSGLNNGSRAVMGAVRRFYDQAIDGTLELPYLKLSGGQHVTGTVSAVEYKLSGVAFVYRDPVNNYHAIVDADGYDASIYLGGAASGYRNIYRAEQHFIQSNNGAVTFATIDHAGISTPQTMSATTITVSGNISAANLSTASSISAGTWINAPQYRLAGVPIDFGAMFSELQRLRERVRALEEAR